MNSNFEIKINRSIRRNSVALIVKDNSEPTIQKVQFQNAKSSNDQKTFEGSSKLKELNNLKEEGLITDEEFEEKRKKIVNEMF